MSHVAPPDNGPDWGVIGGSLAALATIIGTIVAGMKGAFQTKSKDTTDRVGMSFDNIFKLVNELQAEVARKDVQLADQEQRCALREKVLENRIIVHEEAIARQAQIIANLRQELAELQQARRG